MANHADPKVRYEGSWGLLDYVYAAMWFAVALLLFFRFGKMNKIFYFAGALFLVMGGWWLAGAILQQDLFAGALGWAFRGVMAVALVLLCMAYYRERKKSGGQ